VFSAALPTLPAWLVGRRTLGCAALAVMLLLPLVANPYWLFVGNTLLIYVILATGLNLLVGFAGQLAFANAAMFGIGAYGTGLTQVHFGFPFFLAAPCGMVLAVGFGTVLAFPALRLSGLYLGLATLAFAQIAQWVFMHWEAVTFGAGGFKVPPVSFAPLPVSDAKGLYYLTLFIAVAVVLLAANIVRSRIGRAFVAIRDGSVAAESIGIDLLRYKALAFGLSGLTAGIAGALYSGLLNFVAPESFDLFQMMLQKAMVVVGGLGSIAGSVIGATLLTLVQEIAFGALLLGFVILVPNGLADLLRRRVPGWREPLIHPTLSGEADISVTEPAPAPATAQLPTGARAPGSIAPNSRALEGAARQ
jgi:branched-chain amino acid transport system permease protein